MSTVRLPAGPRTARLVQRSMLLTSRTRVVRRWRAQHGSAFMVETPMFGRVLVLAEPAEVKALFMAGPEVADIIDVNLGLFLGPGSLFALRGAEHRRQRKLLTPPFHGRRLGVYEAMVEQEAVREMASWPSGREFATMGSMMRITLNVILRAVFGAEGKEFDQLRAMLPKMIILGSALAAVPVSRRFLGRFGPWARLDGYRSRYDAIVDRLIDRATADPALDERNDVLALMLRSRYDDGTAMSRSEIADQLLTLLAAGHETTGTTLAWAIERLRRHPDLLRRLVDEVDEGGSALREATLLEVQRVRPVVDETFRKIRVESLQLGRWTVPKGQTVVASIRLMHDNEDLFPRARTFDPDRFVGSRPGAYSWIPFGGGARRCIGAAFATMEMNVVLRVLLRDFTLLPTDARGERVHFRGVTLVPARKGRAVVHRRPSRPVHTAAIRSGDAFET